MPPWESQHHKVQFSVSGYVFDEVLVGNGGWLSSDVLRGGWHSTAQAPNHFDKNNTNVQQ